MAKKTKFTTVPTPTQRTLEEINKEYSQAAGEFGDAMARVNMLNARIKFLAEKTLELQQEAGQLQNPVETQTQS